MTDMSKEAMKLALEALEWNMDYLPSHGHGTSMASKAITALREALAEQPAQQLPFGVGGGLVAIKTLLSRDPCVHANTAIEMIDAILADQPAPTIRGDIRDGLVDDEPAQSSKPWVGLEPGEISKIATSDQLAWANLNTVENRQYFARAIEAKLKEKNT